MHGGCHDDEAQKKSCPRGTDTLGEWWPLSRIRKSVCQRLTCAGKKIGRVKAVGVNWVVSRVQSCGQQGWELDMIVTAAD